MQGIDPGVEIVSIADIPRGAGLGWSTSVSVASRTRVFGGLDATRAAIVWLFP
jgi:galactokinase/mevalonate kinase-like predicted kinase